MTPRNRPGLWVPTLYFAEGLPYVTVMTVAVVLYKCLEVSNTQIALFTSWLYLPWVIKPLWSPFVDMFSTKRRWILAMQWGIAVSLGGVAMALPAPGWFQLTIALFWVMAFLSATHDVAADGIYIIGLPQRDQSLLVGVRTLFYRLAMVAGQGGVVALAGWLTHRGSVTAAWQTAMVTLSVLFVVLALWHTFTLPRSESDRPDINRHGAAEVMREFWVTLRTFFVKPGVGVALAFMLLYRFPEAQLVKLIGPFLLDRREAGGMALPAEMVGVSYGTVGVIALIAGGLLGGWWVSRIGLRRALMPMALAMSLTCLTFVWLSFAPQSGLFVVNLCVALEQMGYGFGTTAYTLYLIHYSRGERATSHYALCTGLMALGMMLPGMAAGWLQEQMGYRAFFIYTCACCVITVAAARAVSHRISEKTYD